MVKSDLVKCALGLRLEKNGIETKRNSDEGSKELNELNGLQKPKKKSNIRLRWIKLEI